MRRTVLVDELLPSDISTNSMYVEYERLLELDIIKYFITPDDLIEVNCPGCDEGGKAADYQRMHFSFKVCANCGSHYVSPRPNPNSMEKFYRESEACTFWRKKSLTLPDEKLQKLHHPRIQWIIDLIDSSTTELKYFMDVETKYPFFIKELLQKNLFERLYVLDPKVYEQKELLPKNVLTQFHLEECTGKINIIAAFETIERMYNPNKLFEVARDCCVPGGLLLITTATCSGFEYQVLGIHAPKINPINRMNLLSLEALRRRFEQYGFEIIELSTPGRFDVETARNTYFGNKKVNIHPFWKYIFENRDENTLHDLQTFLQLHCLSSHVRIAAKKNEK